MKEKRFTNEEDKRKKGIRVRKDEILVHVTMKIQLYTTTYSIYNKHTKIVTDLYCELRWNAHISQKTRSLLFIYFFFNNYRVVRETKLRIINYSRSFKTAHYKKCLLCTKYHSCNLHNTTRNIFYFHFVDDYYYNVASSTRDNFKSEEFQLYIKSPTFSYFFSIYSSRWKYYKYRVLIT